MPYKSESTLPIYLDNAIQKLLEGFRLERSPPENVLQAIRPYSVHKPWRNRKKDSLGIWWSLHAAVQASVTTLGEELYAETRRVKEAQQLKYRLLGKKGVPVKISFLGPGWGATRGDENLRTMYTNMVSVGTQRCFRASTSTHSVVTVEQWRGCSDVSTDNSLVQMPRVEVLVSRASSP